MVLAWKMQTARVAHDCDWCGEMVDIGERHWHSAHSDLGRLRHSRMHAECKTAAAISADAAGEPVEVNGSRRGWTLNEVEDGAEPCADEIAVRRLRGMREAR